jgi:hypothetical protein
MGNTLSIHKNLFFKLIIDKNDAIYALNSAEAKDMYLEECNDNTQNSIARTKCNYSPNSIALQEQKYAENYLNMIMSSIPDRLLLDLNKVTIIQLMPSAEGGMPHTRPNEIICYPDISRLYSKSTLIHELWHIHQRLYNDLWLKVFSKLGWTLWDNTLPEHFEKHRRLNPDTIDCPLFIFQDKWIPIPIFKNVTQPEIGEVDIWFYNPNTRKHVTKVPAELSNYFDNIPDVAYEHPREITAYMLSEHDKYSNNTAFKHLIDLIGHTGISNSMN